MAKETAPPEPFDGFSEEALDFYEGLEADNSKAYWTNHKAAYDACVAAPMAALAAELGPRFGTPKVFRAANGSPWAAPLDNR